MQILAAALMDTRLMFRILFIYCVFLFILCLTIIKIERMPVKMTGGGGEGRKKIGR